ncbi:oligosaccharide flippase family protein [uncultured Desulfobacter sp.]|uniref:lipopolysaccharide biosynthesis protein n=1 Tax=uncultured Desulfobacter sp. TaxID=240139 RepID=UPI002AA6FA13|nr:oligosaccharide flippase family protein [uncultured Desulfobacter sp.]
MNETLKQLSFGSLARITYFVASALIGLFMMPFIIKALGNQMFGLWEIIGSIIGFYGLFDIGISSAVMRFVSRDVQLGDKQKQNEYINTAFFAFIIIALVLIIASLSVCAFGSIFIKNSKDLFVFRWVVFILGVGFSFSFPMRVFTGVLNSNHRYDLSSFVDLCGVLLKPVLIIPLLEVGYGIIALSIITVSISVGTYIVKYFFAKRIFRGLRISSKYFKIEKAKEILKYSLVSFVIEISKVMKFKVDNFVIAMVLGLSEITIYVIAARLLSYFMDFMWIALTGMLQTVFSRFEATANVDLIQKRYYEIMRIQAYISAIVGGGMLIFGKHFILRWMGDEYINSVRILMILTPAFIIIYFAGPIYGLLMGTSKHKFFAVAQMGEAMFNLFLSVLLVQYYGLVGIAIGTAVPALLFNALILPIYVCKILKVNYLKFVFIFFRLIFKASMVLFFFWYFVAPHVESNYCNIAILFILEVVFFGVFIFFLELNYKEKINLIKTIKRHI